MQRIFVEFSGCCEQRLQDLVQLAKTEEWFPEFSDGKRDAIGRRVTPLELLIMGSLAVFGG